MQSPKTAQSRSFGEIGRLASRALASANLPDVERHDLEEILQIARRGRALSPADDIDYEAGMHPEPVAVFSPD